MGKAIEVIVRDRGQGFVVARSPLLVFDVVREEGKAFHSYELS